MRKAIRGFGKKIVDDFIYIYIHKDFIYIKSGMVK